MLEDIAELTGAQVVSEDLGLSWRMPQLPSSVPQSELSSQKIKTTIAGGSGGRVHIDARIAQICHEIEKTTSDGFSSPA